MNTVVTALKKVLSVRWNPGLDLFAVILSWVLVTGTLYTATVIVTPKAGGGLPYFLLYAIVAAALFGVGIPLVWMVAFRKRPIQDLGITTKYLGISLLLQLVFAVFQYLGTLAKVDLPAFEQLLPLLALSLAIGFFEAIFWRGWVLLRLEEAFGLLPAVLIGSLLYAAYHIGYGMPMEEIAFLFWIGGLYAVCFRFTRNIFILWPIFQPMGQLVTAHAGVAYESLLSEASWPQEGTSSSTCIIPNYHIPIPRRKPAPGQSSIKRLRPALVFPLVWLGKDSIPEFLRCGEVRDQALPACVHFDLVAFPAIGGLGEIELQHPGLQND